VFTEDTSIAYLDIRDSNLNQICRILNITSGVVYAIDVDRPIRQLYFVPDALLTEKKLSISNITMDNVSILGTVDSAGKAVLYAKILAALLAGDYALALALALQAGDAGLIAALQAGNWTLAAQLADKLNFINKSGSFILTDGTPGDNTDFTGVYFNNGVMYGFTGLVVDSLRFYRVLLAGRVIGYVTSNTATTVTTSLIGYTNLTPGAYSFSPNIGRMPLAFGSLKESVYSYNKKTLIQAASILEYTAPPLPFKSKASLVEHTSGITVTVGASNAKQRLGVRKERLI
jgi:hypothetical protein